MEVGSIVHIQNRFFDLVKDPSMMPNKGNGGYRPHYLCIRDSQKADIFWAIPISSKADKYRAIMEQKKALYGRCDTIVVASFCGRDCAYLIQNAFPITEQFVDHFHTVKGVPVQIGLDLEQELRSKLHKVLSVYRRTGGLLFTNVEQVMKVLE